MWLVGGVALLGGGLILLKQMKPALQVPPQPPAQQGPPPGWSAQGGSWGYQAPPQAPPRVQPQSETAQTLAGVAGIISAGSQAFTNIYGAFANG